MTLPSANNTLRQTLDDPCTANEGQWKNVVGSLEIIASQLDMLGKELSTMAPMPHITTVQYIANVLTELEHDLGRLNNWLSNQAPKSRWGKLQINLFRAREKYWASEAQSALDNFYGWLEASQQGTKYTVEENRRYRNERFVAARGIITYAEMIANAVKRAG